MEAKPQGITQVWNTKFPQDHEQKQRWDAVGWVGEYTQLAGGGLVERE